MWYEGHASPAFTSHISAYRLSLPENSDNVFIRPLVFLAVFLLYQKRNKTVLQKHSRNLYQEIVPMLIQTPKHRWFTEMNNDVPVTRNEFVCIHNIYFNMQHFFPNSCEMSKIRAIPAREDARKMRKYRSERARTRKHIHQQW